MRRPMNLRRISRLISSPKRNAASTSVQDETKETLADEANKDYVPTAPLIVPTASIPEPKLKVKRVDHYYSGWTRTWKYRDSSAKVTPDMLPPARTSDSQPDPWGSFCFVVVRTIPSAEDQKAGSTPHFHVEIKSPYLLRACKHVIQTVPGVSWTADPVQLDPLLLLDYLPYFEKYREELCTKESPSTEDKYILLTVEVLIGHLHKDYQASLITLRNLTSHGEITFDLLHAIFVPRAILVTECPITGEPRALELKTINTARARDGKIWSYELLCETVDALDNGSTPDADDTSSIGAPPAMAGLYGRVQRKLVISRFKGTIRINSLDVYPMRFHPVEAKLREALLSRGRKWMSLRGIHHLQYKGTAVQAPYSEKFLRYNINSRVMIDRAAFKRINREYKLPVVRPERNQTARKRPFPDQYSNDDSSTTDVVPSLHIGPKDLDLECEDELSEDEIILTSPIIYGFSLADKMWLEFNVQLLQPIVWNDDAFANLVLPPGRKMLLQSLVEAHRSDVGFDDFVKGKGQGLVINLYGPPGVGKTFSAEATSEHVRRPLYVVGCGELGTNPQQLTAALEVAFDLATSWKAILLIDEADVFLEQRSFHDLQRNAMVAVFLRHVEYYRGIMFLTTNRIKTFDEAFLSRIHVALHFQDLTKEAKIQVWRAFLQKVGGTEDEFTPQKLEKLGERQINGRQIKNAARTASSLAISRRENVGFAHVLETLDVMEEFAAL